MAKIAVLAATFVTIAGNALSAAGYINGTTPSGVSAKFPTAITPAGYAFTIWTVIYIGLIAFSLYQFSEKAEERVSGIRWLYVATCVLNSAWVVLFHYEMLAACFLVIALLAATLITICYRLREPASFADALMTKAVFGIYCGWVTCATLVNLAIFLGTLGIDAQSRVLGVTLMIIAAVSSFFSRWKLNNYLYPLAVAWALAAIAIAKSGNTPIVITAAFGTVASLVIAGSVVTNLKDSTSEQR